MFVVRILRGDVRNELFTCPTQNIMMVATLTEAPYTAHTAKKPKHSQEPEFKTTKENQPHADRKQKYKT